MSSKTPTFTTPNRPFTWLITGCSSGFGLALTREIQSHPGHTVIATSRNPSRTPDLVAEVEGKGGKWLPLDVMAQDCGHLIDELERTGRHVDILVNNAGGSIHGVVEQLSDEEARSQMELLYFGPYRLIRAVLPYMRKRRFGVIVNISSGAALEGRESMGVYAAAKAALDGLTKVLHKEVAPFNVRALYVSMGTFGTNMGNAAGVQKAPMDEDYKGSTAETLLNFVTGGKFAADGDVNKAVRTIYEVAAAEGIGAGREDEVALPLGRDLAKRVTEIVDKWNRTMEVFGDVCNNVYVEK
ncbi:hypothetical protein GE09DRAFT_559786 [Coniochaeta sp. 2T2.1]|nr:hypothetical protein GE09DRAFT_559786 [Coniochaeta sp. 2T2.1]